MKLFNLLFLAVLPASIFAIDPVSLKVDNRKIQKFNTEKKQVNDEALHDVSISDAHIGTTQDGKWFFGFYLHNNGSMIVRKNQLTVEMSELKNGVGYQIYEGIGRDILPNKKILVRKLYGEYTKGHNHKAEVLRIMIKQGHRELLVYDLPLQPELVRNFIHFKNTSIINNETVKYCVENNSVYTLKTYLTASVYRRDMPVAGQGKITFKRTPFLLKAKNAKCGTLNLGMKVSSKNHRVPLALNDDNSYKTTISYGNFIGGILDVFDQ